jgi:hypothetical protein
MDDMNEGDGNSGAEMEKLTDKPANQKAQMTGPNQSQKDV